MKIRTNLNPRDYTSKEVVRIVNIKQQIFYVSSGVYPIDVYTSYDERNDRKIIVMIFLKSDTLEVYQKWCDYDLE